MSETTSRGARMMAKADLWALVVASIGFYLVLAFAASIFGSYRYEPSGIQYIFLPAITAPLAAGLGIATVAVSVGCTPLLLRVLPFAAALIFTAPAVALPGNAGLELGRWLTIIVGLIHAAVLARLVATQIRGKRPEEA